jgi:hypothetical protein
LITYAVEVPITPALTSIGLEVDMSGEILETNAELAALIGLHSRRNSVDPNDCEGLQIYTDSRIPPAAHAVASG